jgi:hypothetical protein
MKHLSAERAPMIPNLDIDTLLDSLAEKVAARLENRLSGGSPGTVDRRLLTVEQAADYIGRTVPAVRALIVAQAFPSVQTDRRVVLDVRDLDTWINQHKA